MEAVRAQRAGRNGPNPAALRAEMAGLIQTKTRLVAAQTNRLKLTRSYVTFDQVEVFTRLVLYVVSRLGLTTEQLDAFTADMSVVIRAPWRLAELPARKATGDYQTRARALYDELWAERRETEPPEGEAEETEEEL